MNNDKFGLRVTMLIVIIVILGGVFIMNRNINTDNKPEDKLSKPQTFPNAQNEPVATSTADTNTTPITELIAEDIIIGSGVEATASAAISVHYTGTLLNGTKFDSSLDRGTPFNFTLGAGQVIPGWDKGIQGMKVGGTRKLTIPPDLAYGERGQGPIPPNSTLVFEVELLAVE